jgi:hypothetical protein
MGHELPPVSTGSRTQSGQTLIMFALAMTFMFLGLIALVGDADTLMVHYSKVDSAALLGVQAGATAIDEAQFYSGTRALCTDPNTCSGSQLATTRCRTAAAQLPSYQVTCTANGNQVTAVVSETVRLPVPIWWANATVSVTRTGQAVFGGATPAP